MNPPSILFRDNSIGNMQDCGSYRCFDCVDTISYDNLYNAFANKPKRSHFFQKKKIVDTQRVDNLKDVESFPKILNPPQEPPKSLSPIILTGREIKQNLLCSLNSRNLEKEIDELDLKTSIADQQLFEKYCIYFFGKQYPVRTQRLPYIPLPFIDETKKTCWQFAPIRIRRKQAKLAVEMYERMFPLRKIHPGQLISQQQEFYNPNIPGRSTEYVVMSFCIVEPTSVLIITYPEIYLRIIEMLPLYSLMTRRYVLNNLFHKWYKTVKPEIIQKLVGPATKQMVADIISHTRKATGSNEWPLEDLLPPYEDPNQDQKIQSSSPSEPARPEKSSSGDFFKFSSYEVHKRSSNYIFSSFSHFLQSRESEENLVLLGRLGELTRSAVLEDRSFVLKSSLYSLPRFFISLVLDSGLLNEAKKEQVSLNINIPLSKDLNVPLDMVRLTHNIRNWLQRQPFPHIKELISDIPFAKTSNSETVLGSDFSEDKKKNLDKIRSSIFDKQTYDQRKDIQFILYFFFLIDELQTAIASKPQSNRSSDISVLNIFFSTNMSLLWGKVFEFSELFQISDSEEMHTSEQHLEDIATNTYGTEFALKKFHADISTIISELDIRIKVNEKTFLPTNYSIIDESIVLFCYDILFSSLLLEIHAPSFSDLSSNNSLMYRLLCVLAKTPFLSETYFQKIESKNEEHLKSNPLTSFEPSSFHISLFMSFIDSAVFIVSSPTISKRIRDVSLDFLKLLFKMTEDLVKTLLENFESKRKKGVSNLSCFWALIYPLSALLRVVKFNKHASASLALNAFITIVTSSPNKISKPLFLILLSDLFAAIKSFLKESLPFKMDSSIAQLIEFMKYYTKVVLRVSKQDMYWPFKVDIGDLPWKVVLSFYTKFSMSQYKSKSQFGQQLSFFTLNLLTQSITSNTKLKKIKPDNFRMFFENEMINNLGIVIESPIAVKSTEKTLSVIRFLEFFLSDNGSFIALVRREKAYIEKFESETLTDEQLKPSIFLKLCSTVHQLSRIVSMELKTLSFWMNPRTYAVRKRCVKILGITLRSSIQDFHFKTWNNLLRRCEHILLVLFFQPFTKMYCEKYNKTGEKTEPPPFRLLFTPDISSMHSAKKLSHLSEKEFLKNKAHGVCLDIDNHHELIGEALLKISHEEFSVMFFKKFQKLLTFLPKGNNIEEKKIFQHYQTKGTLDKYLQNSPELFQTMISQQPRGYEDSIPDERTMRSSFSNSMQPRQHSHFAQLEQNRTHTDEKRNRNKTLTILIIEIIDSGIKAGTEYAKSHLPDVISLISRFYHYIFKHPTFLAISHEAPSYISPFFKLFHTYLKCIPEHIMMLMVKAVSYPQLMFKKYAFVSFPENLFDSLFDFFIPILNGVDSSEGEKDALKLLVSLPFYEKTMYYEVDGIKLFLLDAEGSLLGVSIHELCRLMENSRKDCLPYVNKMLKLLSVITKQLPEVMNPMKHPIISSMIVMFTHQLSCSINFSPIPIPFIPLTSKHAPSHEKRSPKINSPSKNSKQSIQEKINILENIFSQQTKKVRMNNYFDNFFSSIQQKHVVSFQMYTPYINELIRGCCRFIKQLVELSFSHEKFNSNAFTYFKHSSLSESQHALHEPKQRPFKKPKNSIKYQERFLDLLIFNVISLARFLAWIPDKQSFHIVTEEVKYFLSPTLSHFLLRDSDLLILLRGILAILNKYVFSKPHEKCGLIEFSLSPLFRYFVFPAFKLLFPTPAEVSSQKEIFMELPYFGSPQLANSGSPPGHKIQKRDKHIHWMFNPLIDSQSSAQLQEEITINLIRIAETVSLQPLFHESFILETIVMLGLISEEGRLSILTSMYTNKLEELFLRFDDFAKDPMIQIPQIPDLMKILYNKKHLRYSFRFVHRLTKQGLHFLKQNRCLLNVSPSNVFSNKQLLQKFEDLLFDPFKPIKGKSMNEIEKSLFALFPNILDNALKEEDCVVLPIARYTKYDQNRLLSKTYVSPSSYNLVVETSSYSSPPKFVKIILGLHHKSKMYLQPFWDKTEMLYNGNRHSSTLFDVVQETIDKILIMQKAINQSRANVDQYTKEQHVLRNIISKVSNEARFSEEPLFLTLWSTLNILLVYKIYTYRWREHLILFLRDWCLPVASFERNKTNYILKIIELIVFWSEMEILEQNKHTETNNPDEPRFNKDAPSPQSSSLSSSSSQPVTFESPLFITNELLDEFLLIILRMFLFNGPEIQHFSLLIDDFTFIQDIITIILKQKSVLEKQDKSRFRDLRFKESFPYHQRANIIHPLSGQMFDGNHVSQSSTTHINMFLITFLNNALEETSKTANKKNLTPVTFNCVQLIYLNFWDQLFENSWDKLGEFLSSLIDHHKKTYCMASRLIEIIYPKLNPYIIYQIYKKLLGFEDPVSEESDKILYISFEHSSQASLDDEWRKTIAERFGVSLGCVNGHIQMYKQIQQFHLEIEKVLDFFLKKNKEEADNIQAFKKSFSLYINHPLIEGKEHPRSTSQRDGFQRGYKDHQDYYHGNRQMNTKIENLGIHEIFSDELGYIRANMNSSSHSNSKLPVGYWPSPFAKVPGYDPSDMVHSKRSKSTESYISLFWVLRNVANIIILLKKCVQNLSTAIIDPYMEKLICLLDSLVHLDLASDFRISSKQFLTPAKDNNYHFHPIDIFYSNTVVSLLQLIITRHIEYFKIANSHPIVFSEKSLKSSIIEILKMDNTGKTLSNTQFSYTEGVLPQLPFFFSLPSDQSFITEQPLSRDKGRRKLNSLLENLTRIMETSPMSIQRHPAIMCSLFELLLIVTDVKYPECKSYETFTSIQLPWISTIKESDWKMQTEETIREAILEAKETGIISSDNPVCPSLKMKPSLHIDMKVIRSYSQCLMKLVFDSSLHNMQNGHWSIENNSRQLMICRDRADKLHLAIVKEFMHNQKYHDDHRRVDILRQIFDIRLHLFSALASKNSNITSEAYPMFYGFYSLTPFRPPSSSPILRQIGITQPDFPGFDHTKGRNNLPTGFSSNIVYRVLDSFPKIIPPQMKSTILSMMFLNFETSVKQEISYYSSKPLPHSTSIPLSIFKPLLGKIMFFSHKSSSDFLRNTMIQNRALLKGDQTRELDFKVLDTLFEKNTLSDPTLARALLGNFSSCSSKSSPPNFAFSSFHTLYPLDTLNILSSHLDEYAIARNRNPNKLPDAMLYLMIKSILKKIDDKDAVVGLSFALPEMGRKITSSVFLESTGFLVDSHQTLFDFLSEDYELFENKSDPDLFGPKEIFSKDTSWSREEEMNVGVLSTKTQQLRSALRSATQLNMMSSYDTKQMVWLQMIYLIVHSKRLTLETHLFMDKYLSHAFPDIKEHFMMNRTHDKKEEMFPQKPLGFLKNVGSFERPPGFDPFRKYAAHSSFLSNNPFRICDAVNNSAKRIKELKNCSSQAPSSRFIEKPAWEVAEKLSMYISVMDPFDLVDMVTRRAGINFRFYQSLIEGICSMYTSSPSAADQFTSEMQSPPRAKKASSSFNGLSLKDFSQLPPKLMITHLLFSLIETFRLRNFPNCEIISVKFLIIRDALIREFDPRSAETRHYLQTLRLCQQLVEMADAFSLAAYTAQCDSSFLLKFKGFTTSDQALTDLSDFWDANTPGDWEGVHVLSSFLFIREVFLSLLLQASCSKDEGIISDSSITHSFSLTPDQNMTTNSRHTFKHFLECYRARSVIQIANVARRNGVPKMSMHIFYRYVFPPHISLSSDLYFLRTLETAKVYMSHRQFEESLAVLNRSNLIDFRDTSHVLTSLSILKAKSLFSLHKTNDAFKTLEGATASLKKYQYENKKETVHSPLSQNVWFTWSKFFLRMLLAFGNETDENTMQLSEEQFLFIFNNFLWTSIICLSQNTFKAKKLFATIVWILFTPPRKLVTPHIFKLTNVVNENIHNIQSALIQPFVGFLVQIVSQRIPVYNNSLLALAICLLIVVVSDRCVPVEVIFQIRAGLVPRNKTIEKSINPEIISFVHSCYVSENNPKIQVTFITFTKAIEQLNSVFHDRSIRSRLRFMQYVGAVMLLFNRKRVQEVDKICITLNTLQVPLVQWLRWCLFEMFQSCVRKSPISMYLLKATFKLLSVIFEKMITSGNKQKNDKAIRKRFPILFAFLKHALSDLSLSAYVPDDYRNDEKILISSLKEVDSIDEFRNIEVDLKPLLNTTVPGFSAYWQERAHRKETSRNVPGFLRVIMQQIEQRRTPQTMIEPETYMEKYNPEFISIVSDSRVLGIFGKMQLCTLSGLPAVAINLPVSNLDVSTCTYFIIPLPTVSFNKNAPAHHVSLLGRNSIASDILNYDPRLKPAFASFTNMSLGILTSISDEYSHIQHRKGSPRMKHGSPVSPLFELNDRALFFVAKGSVEVNSARKFWMTRSAGLKTYKKIWKNREKCFHSVASKTQTTLSRPFRDYICSRLEYPENMFPLQSQLAWNLGQTYAAAHMLGLSFDPFELDFSTASGTVLPILRNGFPWHAAFDSEEPAAPHALVKLPPYLQELLGPICLPGHFLVSLSLHSKAWKEQTLTPLLTVFNYALHNFSQYTDSDTYLSKNDSDFKDLSEKLLRSANALTRDCLARRREIAPRAKEDDKAPARIETQPPFVFLQQIIRSDDATSEVSRNPLLE
eukprot:gnl/Chilomastix_cuspidata/5667.p1 GENE.gnl/Chilomastix_cuspidata/5667~~gnl/Chilomastix_cuspidata/5667.p1  ORF type:complete len:4780 (+),score=483.77 gnl/Chilomastix_cuspidata/5667:547-14340(+)